MKIIVFLLLISLFNISFSQEAIPNSNIKTFVEGGRKSKVLTLEESINSFDLQHVESMISSYKIKLAKVDSNIKENKSGIGITRTNRGETRGVGAINEPYSSAAK